ncbi:hypothetical protein ACSV4D_15420 [Flavobacterium sp. ARAG 55.4]
MSKVLCINPLIKITIQSKALFPIALHCATEPNSASDRQTMPQAYNRMKLIGSLLLNDGRKTGSPCFRKSRQHAFRNAGNPACLIAGMQESKKARKQDCTTAGKREHLLSNYTARLNDWLIDGMKE